MNDEQTLVRTPSLEARLAALKPGLDVLGLPACVLDMERRYRYVNPAYCVHGGLEPAAYLGKTSEEIFGQVAVDGRRNALLQALAGETVVFNRRTVDGPNKGLWMRAHYMPVGDGGAVVGALIVLVNVQELKDAEEEIAHQRKQLQLVLDNIGVPMSYVDRDRRFRFANQPGVDWMIADTSEAVGKKVDEMFDAEAMKVIGPEIDAALRGEKRTYERIAKMRDGRERWVRVHLVPDFGEDGMVKGLYSLMIDVDRDYRLRHELEAQVDEIRRAQQQLAAQEAQLRLYTDNIPDAVAYLNRERRIVFANRHFAEQRGVEPGEIIGRTTPELMGAETAAWIRERTQKVFDRGETATYERVAVLPDGSKRYFHVKAVPDFDDA